jgi:hypothetical protein
MTTATTLALPELCGPIDFDMNRDWPCKRLAFAYHLHSSADDIDRTAARIGRARSPRVIRNLTAWVADATERLAKLAPRIAEKPCTCPAPHAYATLTEVPLPPCTC